jgi:4-amino-4-deoxy-L-arabinose transferase-like glycosyltransferase
LTLTLSRIVQRFDRWRFVLALFLLIYAALLLIELGYTAILWDEAPHLYGSLLLSRGQLQEYIQTEAYYPPLFDAVTGLSFKILGPSSLSARLVAVMFSVLSVWAVFEFAHRLHGPKTALLASVLLASMPGFIWLSRMALLETMLLFFFSISMLLFFSWMRTNNDKTLFLSGLILGLGFLVKYQALVGGIIMLVSLLFMGRQRIVTKLGKFLFLLIIVAAVVLPWFFFAFQQYAAGTLGTWFYTLQMGNEGRLVYSGRFPSPVFYLIEMIYPYSHIHPISIPVYIFALLGLGFWLGRRGQGDKFLLIGFFVVYSVFTLIPTKDWRYITLVFPILAISASNFILLLLDKAKENLRAPHISFRDRSITKVAATALVVLVSVSAIFSSWQAYLWVKMDHIHVPVGEACQYVAEHSVLNETAVALFATNLFSMHMMRFYLAIHDPGQRELWQYPENPVDVFEPQFNATLLIEQSEALNVKYLLLFEHGNNPFFNLDWRYSDVIKRIYDTGRFVEETEFGSAPRRIFIIRFLSNS